MKKKKKEKTREDYLNYVKYLKRIYDHFTYTARIICVRKVDFHDFEKKKKKKKKVSTRFLSRI